MAISRIFDISRRSLATYRNALDVTSHNIANASNPDYSRQRVNFATETPEINAGRIWGTGVRLENIFRVKDQLTESQIINNTPKYTFNDKESTLLSQVEQVFSEPSDLGISSLINDFFNSWSELSVTPNSTPLRNNVIYSAQKLASKVDSVQEGMDVIKSDIMQEFKTDVTKVNDYISQIQDLNTKIFEAKARNTEPNDFLDQRDKLINELSKLTNINVTYDDKDVATITIGGVFAADGSTHIKFDFAENNGELVLKSAEDGNVAALNGGEIYALKDMYTNKIPSYSDQLKDVVNAIKDQVNALHSSGYTLDNQTGVDFFQSSPDGRLSVNQDIIDDPNKIAVSADGTSGNGDIANQIAELADTKVLNNQTISDSYSSLISGLGNDKQSSDNMAETNNLVLQQLEQQKVASSGVSVDEEMSNVIKFQRSYDASAKLIKVADEMLQTILTMV